MSGISRHVPGGIDLDFLMLHLKTIDDGSVPLLHNSNTFYCMEMDIHTHSIIDVNYIHMCVYHFIHLNHRL